LFYTSRKKIFAYLGPKNEFLAKYPPVAFEGASPNGKPETSKTHEKAKEKRSPISPTGKGISPDEKPGTSKKYEEAKENRPPMSPTGKGLSPVKKKARKSLFGVKLDENAKAHVLKILTKPLKNY
jgi:hypothetical protein